MSEEEQEKAITRMLEKRLNDGGFTVVSHVEGSSRVIVAEDSKTRTTTTIRIEREKK